MHGWHGVALLTLGGMACGADDGGDNPPDFPRACNEQGACTLYDGAGWVAQDVVDNCADGDLTLACPTGALGECVIDGDTDFSTISRLYPGFWTAQGAAERCSAQAGNWMPL